MTPIPEATVEAMLSDLSCDDQLALARRFAANVGYVVVPDPIRPDGMPADGKRPVAFRVGRANAPGAFDLTDDEDLAQALADHSGLDYEGLYLVGDRRAAPLIAPADGAALPAPPQPLMHPNAEWCEAYERWHRRWFRWSYATVPPDGAVEAAVLGDALTALQACVDQLQQDTHMLYAEYAQTAETTEAEKLARAALARSASPKPGSGE